jgi:putative ABC transport system permease protein
MFANLVSSVRRLARTPGYAFAFMLTLGLAIGINTAIFSVVNGVLLEPLPYADSDRLVYIQQPARSVGVTNASFSFTEIQDYRNATHSVDQLVEYGDLTFNIVGDDSEPNRAIGGLVSSNYFEVLGLTPQLGRTLGPQDDGVGKEPVMVLTHDYWMNTFGGDPSVIDKTVRAYVFSQPKSVRIVGVLRPGPLYTGTRRQDFFVNYAASDHYGGASMLDERTHRMTDVFARLAPGVDLAAAQSELSSIAAGIHREHPDAYPERFGYDISVDSWRDELTRQARPMLLILTGAVVLVLLLACANVANLTLTRLVRRERELAVRSALGAGTRRLRFELLADHLVLAFGGAAIGVALAFAMQGMLVQYASRFTVRTAEIGLDGVVLTFTALLAGAVAILLAWAPRLPGLTALGSATLAASSARGTGGMTRRHMQRALVVCQLALCFTLLVGAGLLVRTLRNLSTVESGLDYQSVVAADVPSITGLPTEQDFAIQDQVTERLRAFPGVRNIAWTTRVPFSPANLIRASFRVEGREDAGVGMPETARTNVTPDYFNAVGIPVTRGRPFQDSDNANGEPVAIVNEALARRLFGADDPINQRIALQQFNNQWGPWLRIVGVAGDTREYGLDKAETHTLYVPTRQTFPGQSVVLRIAGDPTPALQHLRDVVRELDAARPVDNINTLESLRFEDLAPPRLNATLFGAFAILALVIAAVGVFGVLAFNVSQRTREFGVRMALGARQDQVLGMVLREGGILAAIALVVGGIGASLLSSFLRGILYDVDSADPITFAVVGTVLVGVALVAAWLPARRATRVDPADSLRAE